MPTFGDRLKHAWNAFADRNDSERPRVGQYGLAFGQTRSPSRYPTRFANERSIISSIYTRIGIDVAAVSVVHCRLDDQDRFMDVIRSGLHNCLTLDPNLDQGARAFRQDIVMTLLEEGVAAVVPIDTTLSPQEFGGFDIKSMRVGKIVQWYPKHVTVNVYNEETGVREDITLAKSYVAIIENPLYSVMNEPNSTLQRLMRKLALLDTSDDKRAADKLDLIIQLPYTVKTESKRRQAEQRRKDIEFQLTGSQYGIAYADATEKITQLNRPIDNNLLAQIEKLETQLYVQLGLTPEIMNGTADEKAMRNYFARTIEPILDSLVEAMRKSFLTKTARTQGQSIMYFKDPFKFVPIGGEGGIADIADKFARNEITSSNEIRQAIGMKPAKDPKADKLINSNMPQGDTGVDISGGGTTDTPPAPDPADAPDPAVDSMISDLQSSGAEIDAALAAG